MKFNLKMIVATSIMGALTVSAFAQGAGPAGGAGTQGKGKPGQGGPRGGGQGGMKRGMGMDTEVLAKLKLTADQSKQVKALKDKTEAKMKELMAKAKGGDREKMREEFKGVFDGYRTGLSKILTPAQQAQYKKEMAELRKKRGGPGGPGAGGRGAGAGKKGGKGTPPPSI